jgi:hypothetical protein
LKWVSKAEKLIRDGVFLRFERNMNKIIRREDNLKVRVRAINLSRVSFKSVSFWIHSASARSAAAGNSASALSGGKYFTEPNRKQD